MKSFGNSSFGTLTSLFLVLASFSSYTGSVQAAVLPRDGILPPTNVPIDLIPDYFKLLDECNDDSAAVVAVLYEGNRVESYESEECVPRKLNGKYPAQLPVACQAITCNIYPTDDCTGGAILPVPIPLAGGLAIINPFDVLQLVGGSVLCKNL